MKIYDPIVTSNGYGQKKTYARGITSKNWQLLNVKNIGESPLDTKWDKDEILNLPSGTWVDYELLETRLYNTHTIYYVSKGKMFYKSVNVSKPASKPASKN